MHRTIHELLTKHGYLHRSKKLCPIYNKYSKGVPKVTPGPEFLTLGLLMAIDPKDLLAFCDEAMVVSSCHRGSPITIKHIEDIIDSYVFKAQLTPIDHINAIIEENKALKIKVEELESQILALMSSNIELREKIDKAKNILDQ
jgi:hypothetical protein